MHRHFEDEGLRATSRITPQQHEVFDHGVWQVIVVDHRVIEHAAHYTDHPDRGHDLEEWVIESQSEFRTIGLPLFSEVAALGVAGDARFDHGVVVNGRQRWIYAAKRPMSPGPCDRCAYDRIEGAVRELGAEHKPMPAWQAAVLAAIDVPAVAPCPVCGGQGTVPLIEPPGIVVCTACDESGS